jgi:hypothetical protein
VILVRVPRSKSCSDIVGSSHKMPRFWPTGTEGAIELVFIINLLEYFRDDLMNND